MAYGNFIIIFPFTIWFANNRKPKSAWKSSSPEKLLCVVVTNKESFGFQNFEIKITNDFGEKCWK